MERSELAEICKQIDQGGCSVREFLSDCGFISPWGTWHRLQKEELHRAESQITLGKGRNMGKLTLEQKQKAVEIALAGGNPLDYLREIGLKNTTSVWYTIKQTLRMKDPEKYEQLPKRIGAKAAEDAEEPEVKASEAKPAEEVKAGRPAGAEERPMKTPIELEPVAANEAKPERKPLNYAGFNVTGLRAEYGEFKLSSNGYLYFGANDHDELEMPVDIWKKFAKDLPFVMACLGI